MGTSYKGVVRGSHIELEGNIELPDGAAVEVIVADTPDPSQSGPPPAILAALRRPPQATDDDVDALLREVAAGRQLASFRGPFDNDAPP